VANIFWKYSKLSSNKISLDWSVADKVTTRNTTAYFLAHATDVVVERSQLVTAP